MKNLKTIVLEIFPELRGFNCPIKARVVKVYEAAGKIDDFNKRYSVDVQPLKPDGSIDEKHPVIPDVEIPVIWSGQNRGVFCTPVIGSIVRIGFYYNDPAFPFIDAVLGDGFAVPEHAIGSFIIQHSDGNVIKFEKDGTVKIESNQKILFNNGEHPLAFADVIKQVFDSHTHPTTGSPPGTKMSNHDSQKVFTG